MSWIKRLRYKFRSTAQKERDAERRDEQIHDVFEKLEEMISLGPNCKDVLRFKIGHYKASGCYIRDSLYFDIFDTFIDFQLTPTGRIYISKIGFDAAAIYRWHLFKNDITSDEPIETEDMVINSHFLSESDLRRAFQFILPDLFEE